MLEINGKSVISGEVKISGSKNTALPIICSSLLTRGIVSLKNVPHIEDIDTLINIIKGLGVKVLFNRNRLIIDSRQIKYNTLNVSDVSKIRGSSYLLSVMLVLFKKVESAFPGGCKLGKRNLNYHFDAFKKLGANVEEDDNLIEITYNRLSGGRICFSEVSVGATINTIILAAASAKITKIYNYAKEPEVEHTISFLRQIGIKIFEFDDYLLVAGYSKIKKKASFTIPFDRIEAASYIMLGTNAKILTVKNINPIELQSIVFALEDMKADFKLKRSSIVIKKTVLNPIQIKATPYPGFPTDAQPLLCAALLMADGRSKISDSVFKNRFNYTDSLIQMGAKIIRYDGEIEIEKSSLSGTMVNGFDLRGVFSIIIAASMASGITTISDGHIALRGYEGLIDKLNRIGVDIKSV